MIDGPRRWDLTQIFPDDSAAVAGAVALARSLEDLAERAAETIATAGVAELVETLAELEGALEEVLDYARMRLYEDAVGPGVQEVGAAIQAEVTRGQASAERVLDAWRAVADTAAADALIAPRLAPAAYRLRLAREVTRYRLAPAVEAAWEARTESARDRWAALQEIVDATARVRFDDGTGERDWGIGDLGTVLRRPDAEIRRGAYAALADAYAGIREVLATAWDASVADRIAEDRLRGRVHPAQETLDREDLPLEGLRSLVEAVPAAYGARQRLLATQARLMGLDDFSVADADAPVEGLPTLTYDEVAELAFAGLGSLHPTLEQDARALFARDRIDGEIRAGKQQYAVTFLTRLDPPAYVAFRFTGQAANVPLLGHELGHAVALARSRSAQPPVARGWPGVVFEVPSLAGEIAAGDAFAAAYPELEARIRLVLAQDLGWSVFESVAFCLVELDLYEARSGGSVLTGDLIQDTFRRRYAELYGPDVAFDDRDALVALGSWANYGIPSRFYNFQYSVGALEALALHVLRREDPEAFAGRFLTFLGSGRSVSPAAQLEPFGLDFGPKTWATGLAELGRRFALVEGAAPPR